MGCDRVPGPFNDAVDRNDRERLEHIKRHPIGEKEMKRIMASLERANIAYTAEFARLDRIAVDVYHGQRCGFLKKYVAAWMHADAGDKRVMRSAWVELIVKYNLEVDPEGTGVPEEAEDSD